MECANSFQARSAWRRVLQSEVYLRQYLVSRSWQTARAAQPSQLCLTGVWIVKLQPACGCPADNCGLARQNLISKGWRLELPSDFSTTKQKREKRWPGPQAHAGRKPTGARNPGRADGPCACTQMGEFLVPRRATRHGQLASGNHIRVQMLEETSIYLCAERRFRASSSHAARCPVVGLGAKRQSLPLQGVRHVSQRPRQGAGASQKTVSALSRTASVRKRTSSALLTLCAAPGSPTHT